MVLLCDVQCGENSNNVAATRDGRIKEGKEVTEISYELDGPDRAPSSCMFSRPVKDERSLSNATRI